MDCERRGEPNWSDLTRISQHRYIPFCPSSNPPSCSLQAKPCSSDSYLICACSMTTIDPCQRRLEFFPCKHQSHRHISSSSSGTPSPKTAMFWWFPPNQYSIQKFTGNPYKRKLKIKINGKNLIFLWLAGRTNTSVADPDPGSGAFMTPGSPIRDPE